MIASVPEFSDPHQRTLGDEIDQVACCRCRRCPGDRAVVACAKSVLESFWTFSKHPQQRFLLPVVQLPPQLVE